MSKNMIITFEVIQKALQNYFDIHSVTKTVQDYKMGMLKTVSHKDLKEILKKVKNSI